MQLTRTSQTAALTAAAPTAHPEVANLGLALLRLQLVKLLRNGVFTRAELDKATATIYATSDASKLTLWKKNVARVKAEREAAALATQPAPAAADAPDAEEIEAEAAAAELTVEQLADLSSHPAPTVNPHLSRAYGNSVAERERRGRTSDFAGELAYAVRGEAFFMETGMTYSELAQL